MFKQADVAGQAFELKKMFISVLLKVMLPPRSLTSQTILKQEAGPPN
jgi:hypothetical protein